METLTVSFKMNGTEHGPRTALVDREYVVGQFSDAVANGVIDHVCIIVGDPDDAEAFCLDSKAFGR